MTRIAIFPTHNAFRAVAGDKRSVGRTAGEALDAITTQLPDSSAGTLIILQSFKPDEYFNANQQHRLAELMDRWRHARDTNGQLSASEQAELDALADAELKAATQRTQRWLQELGR